MHSGSTSVRSVSQLRCFGCGCAAQRGSRLHLAAGGALGHTSRPFMHWIVLTLVSALFLGCYELCIKHAVRDNAVLPVLFLSNLCSASVWLLLMGAHAAHPGLLPASLAVPALTWHQHLLLAAKSALIVCAWVYLFRDQTPPGLDHVANPGHRPGVDARRRVVGPGGTSHRAGTAGHGDHAGGVRRALVRR